jgi:hypothetical protein
LDAINSTTPPAGARRGPRLTFTIEDAGPLVPAAVPTLRFGLRIEDSGSADIRSVALNAQVRIAATRRRYDKRDEERLVELFGRPEQWARSLQSLHWTNVPLQVRGFTESTEVDIPVPCTYDLEVSATRYFHALEDGEVPLEFLFSGTAFYAGEAGGLQVAPIAWDCDADFRMPVAVWRETMDRVFPGSAWLRLDKERFDRLHAYRARKTLLTWEDAVDSLLNSAEKDSADSALPSVSGEAG